MNTMHSVEPRDGANLPPAIPRIRTNAASERHGLSGQSLATSVSVQRISDEQMHSVPKRGESPPRTTAFNLTRPPLGSNSGSTNLPAAIPSASASASSISALLNRPLIGQSSGSILGRSTANLPPAVPSTSSSVSITNSHSSGMHAVPKRREENMRPAVPSTSSTSATSRLSSGMNSVSTRSERNMSPAVPPPSLSSSSIGQMHSVGKRN